MRFIRPVKNKQEKYFYGQVQKILLWSIRQTSIAEGQKSKKISMSYQSTRTERLIMYSWRALHRSAL